MTGKIINAMIAYFGSDVRRINHSLKVYGYAKAIGCAEGLDEKMQTSLEYAAVLHDIGIRQAELRHGSSAGHYQEMEGPPVAHAILTELGVNPFVIERVCYLVGHHHSYHLIDGPDFQILIEADFIVNAFEEGMDAGAIRAAWDKYFRSEAGRRMLRELYGV